MQIQNFAQWLKNHEDKQQSYMNSGQHDLATKTCFLCCEELLQKKHHFTDEENAQALDFFCTQLSMQAKKKRTSLIQIETKRQFYRASAAFQQLGHAITPVSGLLYEQLLLQLKNAYVDFLSIINKEWLLLLNNAAYRPTVFSKDPYRLGQELQLFDHLRLLVAIIEQYAKHHSQFIELTTLESNKDLALQLKLCKAYICRFLSSVHDSLTNNDQYLEKLSGEDVLLLMKLNLDTTEVLDKQHCGKDNNSRLYGKYLFVNIRMDSDRNFTRAAENILRQGYPQTSTSQPSNVNNSSAFAERIGKIGSDNGSFSIRVNVVSNENTSDIILSELKRLHNYIESEHTQFIQSLQNEPQNSEHDPWLNKTSHADLYLYFINMVALIRFYLDRNDFARASKTLKAMGLKLHSVLPDKDAYFIAFVAFNPRHPLLQEYCFALTAAADELFDIFSSRWESFRLCLRDNFKYSLKECLVKVPQLISGIYLYIEAETFDKAEENLNLLKEKVNEALRLTEKDFQGMPVDTVSQQDINKLFLVVLDSLMKFLLSKANKIFDLEHKRRLYHYAELLAIAAEAFLSFKYLDSVCQNRGTQLTIAKSKFYSQFYFQPCEDSEAFERLYHQIRKFNDHIVTSLPNPVEQFELLIAQILYLNSMIEIDDVNLKQKALMQHMHDIQYLFDAHAALNSHKKYQIQFHYIANLCYFSDAPDYNEAIKHSCAALQIFGQPTQFNSAFDHEYFYYAARDLINAHVGLISDQSSSDEQQADKTRTLLLRLFSCLEESWFFSTDSNTFNERLSPYTNTKHLLKIIEAVINISMDTLVHVNIFAIQNPNDVLFTAHAYRVFAARLTSYINLLHSFAFHEMINGRMFALNTYAQLARLHIYVLLLCDAQHPALLRINELQTFCDHELIKSKNPDLDTEAIEELSLTLADLNIQLTMLASHPFLSVRNNLLPVLSFINTIDDNIDTLQEQAPKPLTNLPFELLESVKEPALHQYCRFVYALAVTKFYYNRQDKSNFIIAFKSLQSDANELTNLNLQDLRYHFYTFLQPQLMRDYLIFRSFMYLLEFQYALAASCIDVLNDLCSETYVFDELADIYDLEKAEEEQYLQDKLSQLICMVQRLRITLEYESPHKTLQVFIQHSQPGDPSHSENPAQTIWQQLPILDKSSQPIDKSSAQELIPFIDECLLTFTLACKTYLQTDFKKTAKEGLLNINHLKQSYEALFPYLSREQGDLFQKLIKKIEQNIKQNIQERKSKKAQANISVISTDFTQDTSTTTVPPAVSSADSKTSAVSSAPKNRANIVAQAIPKKQQTRTQLPVTASPKIAVRSSVISAKSPSAYLPKADGTKTTTRNRSSANNYFNDNKNRQTALSNSQPYEAAGVSSAPLAKPSARPASNPNSQLLNGNMRILHPSSPILAKQPAPPIITSNNHAPVKLAANITLSDLTQAIYATTGKMPSYAAVAKGHAKKTLMAAPVLPCQTNTSDKLETTQISAQYTVAGNPQVCIVHPPMTSHEVKVNSDQIPIHVQNASSSQSIGSVNLQSITPATTTALEPLKSTAPIALKNLEYWSIEYNNIITLYNAYAIELEYHLLALNVHLEALDVLGYRLQFSELQNCYYLQKIKLHSLDLSKPLPLNQAKATNDLTHATIKGASELLSSTKQMKDMPLPDNLTQLSAYCSKVQALSAQLSNETKNIYRSHDSLVADLNHKNRLLKTCIEALQVISQLGTRYEIHFNREEVKSYLIASKPCELVKILTNC